jgi:hypothetical protein
MINDSFFSVNHYLYIFVLHHHLLLLNNLTCLAHSSHSHCSRSSHASGCCLIIHIVAERPWLWEVRWALRLMNLSHMMVIMLMMATTWVLIVVLGTLILLLSCIRRHTYTLLKLLLSLSWVPEFIFFTKTSYIITVWGKTWLSHLLSLEATCRLHI